MIGTFSAVLASRSIPFLAAIPVFRSGASQFLRVRIANGMACSSLGRLEAAAG